MTKLRAVADLPPQAADDDFASLIRLWDRHLAKQVEAGKKSPRTRESYVESAELLRRWLIETERPTNVSDLTPEDLHEYFYGYVAKRSKRRKVVRSDLGTVRVRYASLSPFFAWLVAMGEIETNPVKAVERPTPKTKPARILTLEEIQALYDVTKGKEFTDRRDHAIFKMFLNTGMRLNELAGIRVEDLNLKQGHVEIREAKGRKPRIAPLNDDALEALEWYLRERTKLLDTMRPSTRRSAESFLWISTRGHYRGPSIQTMVKNRTRSAGLEGVHAHLFRSAFIRYAVPVIGDVAVKRIVGHSSLAMIERYTDAAKDEMTADVMQKTGFSL